MCPFSSSSEARCDHIPLGLSRLAVIINCRAQVSFPRRAAPPKNAKTTSGSLFLGWAGARLFRAYFGESTRDIPPFFSSTKLCRSRLAVCNCRTRVNEFTEERSDPRRDIPSHKGFQARVLKRKNKRRTSVSWLGRDPLFSCPFPGTSR